MTTPPHDGGRRDDSTQWSWDNVPQVEHDSPSTPNEAGYGERRFSTPNLTPSGPPPVGGYAPIPVGGNFGEVRPGIIPLRPLKLGEFFDGGFSAIRFNPGVMLGVAAIVIFTSLLIELLLSFTVFQTFGDIIAGAQATSPAISDQQALTFLLSVLASSLVSFIASTILTGLLIQCVTQSILGRRVTLSDVWQQSKGRILPLFGLTLVIATIVVVMTIVMILVFIAFLLGIGSFVQPESTGSVIAMVLFVAVGVVGTLVAVLWFYVKTALATPVLMAEKAGVFASIKRSFALTRGYFWRIAGILFLTLLLMSIMVGIVSSLFGGIMSFGLATSGATDNPADLFSWSSVISAVINSLLELIFTPFLAAVVTLVYTDTRMRKEGLDLLLQRAAAQNS